MSTIGRSLTSHAGEQLPGKVLDLTTRKRYEAIPLQKVENTLAQQVGDYTYVVPEVETVAKMYAFVAVVLVVHGKSRKYSKLNSRGVAIFLHRTYDLDSTSCLPSLVICFDNLSKGSLTEHFDDIV